LTLIGGRMGRLRLATVPFAIGSSVFMNKKSHRAASRNPGIEAMDSSRRGDGASQIGEDLLW